MRKILVVEDDQHLHTILTDTLAKEYAVTSSFTLTNAFDYLESSSFDLIIVDRKLPDGDSLSLINHVQDISFSTRILAISCLSQPAEKIKGLESGADDYLPKPFSVGELKLKVKKMLSYEKRKQAAEYRLYNLQFSPESGELTLGKKQWTLRRKEAQILSCLFKYKNRVVSREKIIDEVWSHQGNLPTQTTLDVYIRRIRILLGEYGNRIITKRGFGYLLSET